MSVSVVQVDSRQSSQIDHPHELTEYLSGQSDRWQDFHETSRLLVIDDNFHTASMLQRDLNPLYGEENVSVTTDVQAAIELINAAYEAGTPFDALVLDLYMPKMTGLELIKELGDRCPAIVINTASMTSEAVADLAVQMDNYRSHSAAWLFEQHREEKESAELPLVPIFIHHKSGTLGELVNKIDSALFVKDRIVDLPDAISGFLEIFNPKHITPGFSSETVHEISEEMRNLRREVLLISGTLLVNHDLESTTWWAHNGDALLSTLEELKSVSYSSLMAETPQQSWTNVHSVLGKLLLLSPRRLEREMDIDLVADWAEIYTTYSERIDNLAAGLRAYQEGKFNIDHYISGLCEKHGLNFELGRSVSKRQLGALSDPTGEIRSLLEKLIKTFKKRVEENGIEGEEVFFAFNTEMEKLILSGEELEALDRIDCGAYYNLMLIDPCFDLPMEESYEPLTGDLVEFTRKGFGLWELRPGDAPNQNNFVLSIKAEPKTIDFKAKEREVAKQREKLSFMLEGEPVYEGLGRDGNLTVIGKLPEEKIFMSAGDSLSVPGLLHQYKGRTFFASERHHKEAGDLLSKLYERLDSEFQDLTLSSDLGYAIYHQAIRVDYDGEHVYLEIEADDPDKAWAYQALLDLGIPEHMLICNPQKFQRKY